MLLLLVLCALVVLAARLRPRRLDFERHAGRNRYGRKPVRHDRGRRLEHGGPARDRRGRGLPGGEPRTSRSRSASPAPAAASRGSAPARPTSPTPPGRSRTTKRCRVCKKNGIEYTEFQVANDGIAVVVNTENDWAKCLTVEQLEEDLGAGLQGQQLEPGRPELPGREAEAAGPGTDSGTFDYFTDEINGEEGASRTDYQATEDDNVIVQACQGDKGDLGYFGLSYFEQNQDKLNDVEVDGGDGCVAPSARRSRTAPTRRSPGRCSSTSKNRRCRSPRSAAFVKYILDNQAQIAAEGAVRADDRRAGAEGQVRTTTAATG